MAKTIEGKSRLVYLTYQVLDKVDVVAVGKSDSELGACVKLVRNRYRGSALGTSTSQDSFFADLPEPRATLCWRADQSCRYCMQAADAVDCSNGTISTPMPETTVEPN